MPGSSIGDRSLGRRLIARDVEALGEAYDLYAGAVYGVALKVAGDVGAAQEVTRTVFLDMWHRPNSFDPDKDRLRPWLAGLAHQHAVEARREAAANRRRDERAASDRDWVVDIDEAVDAVVNAEQVRAALAELPPDEQGPIRMAYFSGRTYQEVALELGLPDDVVKSRMNSGLRRMAAALHPDEIVRGTNLGP